MPLERDGGRRRDRRRLVGLRAPLPRRRDTASGDGGAQESSGSILKLIVSILNSFLTFRSVLACNFDFSEFVRRILRGLVETS